jgi:hydroxymethylpyrimidine/phosphomethylpyrimidine kinase
VNLLSIGGSDPSSGAGIQNDLKTFDALNAYGLTVVTAITSQNTTRFGQVYPASKKITIDQIDTVFSDFPIDGIKIGMVYNSELIKIIHHKIKKFSGPIIVDPVIKSTTGGMLIQKSAILSFRKYLVPIASVITPNKFEAEIISKTKIDSLESLTKAAKSILKMGAKAVVITGLEFEKGEIMDFLLTNNIQEKIKDKKLKRKNHGSGCTFSAALLFGLVESKSLFESAKFAHKFTFESIKNAKTIGKGIPITKIKKDELFLELSQSIDKFIRIKNISARIPECQTNFVFSKKNPKTEQDVMGISGRIVKSGNNAIQAGSLQYGASKHVANAVLTLNKKFPKIRSAINLKMEKETINALKKNGFRIKNYDRTKEPNNTKNTEGSSIIWGMNKVLKGTKIPPDAIYHNGDFGKEPMILIFGNSPKNVVKKISTLFE